MSKLSWGKCRLFTWDADEEAANAYELPTPVEGTTELTPTKGDKMEAPIEGGELEDVKYKRSTYAVNYNIRKAKGRHAPYPSTDGLVDHHYGLLLVPEDPSCEGFLIESTTVGVDDTFTAADGAMWQIQHDAVKAQTGDTVKWGTTSISNNQLVFTERSSHEGTGNSYTKTINLSSAEPSTGVAGEPASPSSDGNDDEPEEQAEEPATEPEAEANE